MVRREAVTLRWVGHALGSAAAQKHGPRCFSISARRFKDGQEGDESQRDSGSGDSSKGGSGEGNSSSRNVTLSLKDLSKEDSTLRNVSRRDWSKERSGNGDSTPGTMSLRDLRQGDSSKDGSVKGDLGEGDSGKSDLGEGDSGKSDLSLADLGEGDSGRSDSDKGDSSAFEDLFNHPNAFERSEEPRSVSRRSQARRRSDSKIHVSKTVLSSIDDLNSDYTKHLNKEWEGRPGNDASRGDGRDRPNLNRRRGNDNYRGVMTSREQKLFSQLFANVFDGGNAKGGPPDDGLFGSTLLGGKSDSLLDFRARNVLNWDPKKTRKSAKAHRFPGLLTEGVTAESVTTQELEEKIDLAREEITACQSVADVWQWASRNVWGSQQEERQAEREDGEGQVDSNREAAVSRFGMSTPFYAPVLHLLLVTLRERFKSPQSALSILRIAKNLGPDSFVLGCTPQLYTEALSTRWTILQDLQGARDTLQEAKDTGMLGSGSSRAATLTARVTSPERAGSADEAEGIRDIVNKQIKTEVRKHVVDGSKRLSGGQQSQAYAHQLQLVSEMDSMLGRRPAA